MLCVLIYTASDNIRYMHVNEFVEQLVMQLVLTVCVCKDVLMP